MSAKLEAGDIQCLRRIPRENMFSPVVEFPDADDGVVVVEKGGEGVVRVDISAVPPVQQVYWEHNRRPLSHWDSQVTRLGQVTVSRCYR